MSATVMNPYGQQAWNHWKTWRPTELSQIPDPAAFFSRLGLDVEAQIDQVAADLAGDDPAGEDYLAKVGRLRMARATAESQVLRELVLLPAEPGHPEYDPTTEQMDHENSAEAPWLPVVMTPQDPGYHDLDDDSSSTPSARTAQAADWVAASWSVTPARTTSPSNRPTAPVGTPPSATSAARENHPPRSRSPSRRPSPHHRTAGGRWSPRSTRAYPKTRTGPRSSESSIASTPKAATSPPFRRRPPPTARCRPNTRPGAWTTASPTWHPNLAPLPGPASRPSSTPDRSLPRRHRYPPPGATPATDPARARDEEAPARCPLGHGLRQEIAPAVSVTAPRLRLPLVRALLTSGSTHATRHDHDGGQAD